MHEVYAAVRLWQLEYVQRLPEHARVNAFRIMGEERWKKIQSSLDPNLSGREHLQQLAFAVLHSSEWYDDPNDTIRTMTNMEMSAIYYIDERFDFMENWPLYVIDKKNPKSLVGIEQTFDVVLEFKDKKRIRYIGTMDGLMWKDGKTLYLDENKTASRLDDAWRLSFDMKHQVTGYCAAATTIVGVPVFNARVTGAKIRPTNRGEDIITVEVKRDHDAIQHWARWLRHTVELYEAYKDDYENAPRYTHSCNRYFRPCSLLPFCSDTKEGRQEQWEQMQATEPSPSERAVND